MGIASICHSVWVFLWTDIGGRQNQQRAAFNPSPSVRFHPTVQGLTKPNQAEVTSILPSQTPPSPPSPLFLSPRPPTSSVASFPQKKTLLFKTDIMSRYEEPETFDMDPAQPYLVPLQTWENLVRERHSIESTLHSSYIELLKRYREKCAECDREKRQAMLWEKEQRIIERELNGLKAAAVSIPWGRSMCLKYVVGLAHRGPAHGPGL